MCGFFTMTWNRHGGNPLLGNPCQFRHPTTPTPGTGHAFAAALAKVPSSSGAAEVPWEWWHIWSLKGMMKAGQKPATDVAHLLYTHQLQLTTTKKSSLQSLKGDTAKKYAMISKIAFVVWGVHSFPRFFNLLNPHFVLPNLYFTFWTYRNWVLNASWMTWGRHDRLRPFYILNSAWILQFLYLPCNAICLNRRI